METVINRKIARRIAGDKMRQSGLRHINKKWHKNEFPVKLPQGMSFFSIAWKHYI